MGVSERTVIRLEKGDSGVSMGTLAMACLVLGEIHRISELLDPGSDDTGLLLDRESLPKRIDGKRRSGPAASNLSEKIVADKNDDPDDSEGVGF